MIGTLERALVRTCTSACGFNSLRKSCVDARERPHPLQAVENSLRYPTAGAPVRPLPPPWGPLTACLQTPRTEFDYCPLLHGLQMMRFVASLVGCVLVLAATGVSGQQNQLQLKVPIERPIEMKESPHEYMVSPEQTRHSR